MLTKKTARRITAAGVVLLVLPLLLFVEMLEGGREWMMAFIGTVSVGAVAVPMNGWWTAEELEYGISDSGSRIIIADCERAERMQPFAADLGLTIIAVGDCSSLSLEHTDFNDLLEAHRGRAMPEVKIDPDDYATIMYTSGSTGRPKGALSSHRGVLAALFSWLLMGTAANMLGGGDSDEEPAFQPCCLLTVPLFHCTGSHAMFLLSLIVVRKLVIMHKWDPQEALRLVEEERVTYFNGVPTMSAELQAAAADS